MIPTSTANVFATLTAENAARVVFSSKDGSLAFESSLTPTLCLTLGVRGTIACRRRE